MELFNVASSNIEKIGYDKETRTLQVTFNGNRSYLYSNVPEEIFDMFMESQSKGQYFKRYIEPNFK